MIINNIEILDHIWYGKFGFVKGQDTITKEIKFYAGEGLGNSEQQDLYLLINFGTKYTEESFYSLLKWFTPKFHTKEAINNLENNPKSCHNLKEENKND